MPPETIRSRTEPRNLFSSHWWPPFHMESIRVSMNKITTFTVIDSPIGSITVVSKDGVICGLYNEGQKHWPEDSHSWRRDDGPVFDPVRKWLSEYFSGKKTRPLPKIAITTGTAFQKQVWNELLTIPAGETVSYGELAGRIGSPKSVRAVGAAVGRNPISIMVPCHRVVGAGGKLTGYAGGLEKKRWLLKHERGQTSSFENI